MQNPKPFAIYQPVPGQSAKPLFVNHAYSLEQARARSSRQQYPARPSWSARSRETEQTGDPRYPQRPSRHGLRVSDAEGDQAGLEREAMEFAAELMHTSKPMHTMLCNRLLDHLP
jgi:hypothetical protein